MSYGVGPGSVWVARDYRGGFRTVVLLVEEVTVNVAGEPYTGEPAWNGVVLTDKDNPTMVGRRISYTRSHLFDVFERLT